MAYWLMKSEPDVFGIDALAQKPKGVGGWDGVRNYQARNFMRAMKIGDRVIFYHSNAKPSGAAGIAEVVRTAYPDPTQFDSKGDYFEPRSTPARPLWDQVDLRFIEKFKRFLSLDEMRAMPALEKMPLFRASRLSVQPVSASQWAAILKAAR